MTTKVRSNLLAVLHEAEEKNKRRYGWTYIGDKIGRSRQATELIFLNEQTDDSYVKYGLLGKLLDFFKSEGLTDVKVGDFFIEITDDLDPVTETPDTKTHASTSTAMRNVAHNE